MKPCRNFGPRCWSRGARARAAAALILIALLSFWSAGCGRRVSYVEGGHKLTRLEPGQPAPRRGVLLSEEYLSQIYDALGEKAPGCKPPPAGVKLQEKREAALPE